MKVSDVDINQIVKLLNQVPEDMTVESIELTNGYEIRLITSLKENSEEETQRKLDELLRIIKGLDKTQNNV